MVSLLVFIYGLLIGSFLNVVIYRLPENKSIVFPGSHCFNCNTRLKVVDLIPVLSWVFTKGKCRYCGEKVSWQYPLVELITAILFLLLFLNFGFSVRFFILLLLISVLIVCSVIDLKYKIIPNKITYPSIIIALILSFILNHITFISSFIGILIPGGLLLLLALLYGKGLGMGDVKLVAVIGAVLGWQFTLLGIFIGSFFGAIIGITLMITGVIDRRTRIPFGPLISIGIIISIFYGHDLLNLIVGHY